MLFSARVLPPRTGPRDNPLLTPQDRCCFPGGMALGRGRTIAVSGGAPMPPAAQQEGPGGVGVPSPLAQGNQDGLPMEPAFFLSDDCGRNV